MSRKPQPAPEDRHGGRRPRGTPDTEASTRIKGGNRKASPYASWRALWSALRGRCPNCGQGRLFAKLLSVQIRATCSVCGVRFERDAGAFLGPSTLAYVVAVVVEVVLFLVLVRRYGLFPGLEWVLVSVGVGVILVTWKPLKGFWVWLLWVSGLVWTDRIGSS